MSRAVLSLDRQCALAGLLVPVAGLKPNFNLQCLHCAKTVTLPLCRQKDSVFCSRWCLEEHKRPIANSVCLSCHQWFYRKQCELKRADKIGVGKFCSMGCKARWMSAHAMASGKARGRGGKRPDLNNRYFRSSWEANWARYLNWLISIGEIRSWDFECKTFEFKTITRGGRFYTPDFEVVNRDGSVEYHEVKGYFSPADQTKMKRMTRHYPAVVVKLIERKAYYATARQVAAMCPGWE